MHEKKMTILTKKYRAEVQQQGMPQHIIWQQIDVTANVIEQKDTRLFCQEDHCCPGCKKWLRFCGNALEYTLSLNTPSISIAAKAILSKSMPVVTDYKQTKASEKLEQSVINHNFITHKASKVDEFPVHQVKNMKFLVTFLKKNGKQNEPTTRIWVPGNLTNNLIYHKFKKYCLFGVN